MKGKIVLLFVFVFVFMFAAGPVCGQYTAGVKAGVNVSDVYFAYGALKEDIRFGMGLNVGLFVNRRLHDRWDLQVEAAYSQQGYRCVRPVRSSGSTEVLNGYRFFTHYLNLPVMLMFYPLERGLCGRRDSGRLPSGSQVLCRRRGMGQPGSGAGAYRLLLRRRRRDSSRQGLFGERKIWLRPARQRLAAGHGLRQPGFSTFNCVRFMNIPTQASCPETGKTTVDLPPIVDIFFSHRKREKSPVASSGALSARIGRLSPFPHSEGEIEKPPAGKLKKIPYIVEARSHQNIALLENFSLHQTPCPRGSGVFSPFPRGE